MDYSAQGSAPVITAAVDNRKSPRKPMRQRITLGTTSHGIVQGHTRDISAGGLSVMIPISLTINAVCVVHFELMVDGRLVHFSGSAKIVHCALSGMDGFRVGMKLHLNDAKLVTALERFISM
jgi:PilZ domain